MRIRHINMLICEVCMKRIQNAYKMYKVRARGRGRGAGVGVARAWATLVCSTRAVGVARGHASGACVYGVYAPRAY